MRFPARLFLAPLVFASITLLAACGPGTEEPPETVQETPEEAAAVPDSVVGTYRLVAVDGDELPGGVGTMDECEVQLTEGTVKLGADARYKLDVLARAVCDPEEDEEAQLMDRATSEGPFVVEGFEVRFSEAVTRVDDEMAEENAADTTEPDTAEDDGEMEEDMPDLFDTAQFAGVGTLRDTTLIVRLADDLTTLSFVRE